MRKTKKIKINDRVDITCSFSLATVPNTENLKYMLGGEILKNISDITSKKALSYGEVEVIVSNSGVDRHGESIANEGIDIKQIKRNPVVLWAHNYSEVPLGRITKLWRSNGSLYARIKFDYDIYEFADLVYKMVLRGTINAVSIGGIVKAINDDFTVIEELEMVELSIVPVGAHPDALVVSKATGVDRKIVQESFKTFERKAVVDKFYRIDENRVNKYIDTLKDLVKILESSNSDREPEEVNKLGEQEFFQSLRKAIEDIYKIRKE